MSSIFAEKESEKLQLKSEIESLREKISRMECTNDSQQGDFKKRSQNIEGARGPVYAPRKLHSSSSGISKKCTKSGRDLSFRSWSISYNI
jgi:hypothetical protein